MKVTIGPYKYWFGPYQLAELLCFWVRPVKDEYGIHDKPDWVHKFGELLAHGSIAPTRDVGEYLDLLEERPKTALYNFLLWLNKQTKRKNKVRIDPWDTWGMDTTLGYIIRPMLWQLMLTKHGAPDVDDEDVPENLRSTSAPPKENDYDVDDNHFKRWDWVLGEMIFAFDSLEGGLHENWEDQFRSGKADLRFKKIAENGTSELVHGPNHTAKVDWEARNLYAERIQNGFRLFGKYYQSLWD